MATLDQLLTARSTQSQKRIQELATDMIVEMQLSEIRSRLALSQEVLAKRLGISQPAVVALEQRGADIKLSSLKRVIDAMGGQLRLEVTLPDGDRVEVVV